MSATGPLPQATPDDATAAETPRPTVRATLVRMRIAGFKSFAEATQVDVLPGLTGIVGPNGCGKSNVVEALRWAMGETSARSLRGGEMDDVIFAGTANRPGRNIAEVMLSLDDAAGLAPAPFTDASELELVRRIERGAGSSFRLNGKEVRARDIQTMFADIGSGARASGMVSQGRVATLIQAKPEDRRAVLEEAAGIAGLRARRHEAELKLRQAEANLTRAEDLLGQLETQRLGLQKQARQANRYRNISGLVRQAEGEWLALLRARAGAALAHAMAQLQAARALTQSAEQIAESAARAAFAAEHALPEPREQEAQARSALERRRVEAEGLEAEQRRAEEALAAAQNRAALFAQDRAHAERMAEDARTAEAALAQEDEALARAEASLPARIEEAREQLARAADAARTAELEANVATEEAAALAARANQADQDLVLAEQRHDRLSRQLAEMRTEVAHARAALVMPERLTGAVHALQAAERAASIAREALEQSERQRMAAVEALSLQRRLLADAEAEHSRARQTVQLARQRLGRMTSQHDRLAADLEAAQAARVTPERLAVAEERTSAAEAALGQARAAVEAAEADRARAQQRRSEARQALAEVETRRTRAEEDVAAARRRLQDLGSQRAMRESELRKARAEEVPPGAIEAAEFELALAEAALADTLARLERAEVVRAETAAQQERARTSHAAAHAEASRLRAEVSALTETLAAMPDGGSAMPVSATLSIPSGLEAAIGAALGEALESPADTGAPRHWRTLPAQPGIQVLPDGVTSLSSMLTPPPPLMRAISQIGILNPGVDGAAMQPRLLPGQVVVDRAGAVWRWDGFTATAEVPNPEVVRLQQRSRLRGMEARANAAMAAVAAAEKSLAEAARSAAEAASEEAALRLQRGACEDRLAAARARRTALAAQAAESSGRAATLQTQVAWLAAEHAAAAETLRVAEEALAALPEVAALRQEVREAEHHESNASQTEARARALRTESEASLQRVRAEATQLGNAAMQVESRISLIEPQLAQATADLREAQASLIEAETVLAGLPDMAALNTAAEAAALEATQAQANEAQRRSASATADGALAEARDALTRLEREANQADNRFQALTVPIQRLETEFAEAEARLADARAAKAEAPNLVEIRAGVERARAALSAVRAAEVAAREALSVLQGEQGRILSRRETIAMERAGWGPRLADAAERLAELRQRCDDAQATADALAGAPAEVAARKAALGRAVAELEAAHAAAAQRLVEAEATQRASIEARRVADAGFAAAREGQLRAEGAREHAEAAVSAVEDRIVERLGENAELPSPEDLTDVAEDRARRKLERLVREREDMGPVNLRAEGELDELEARASEITRERDEITAAIAKLRGTIGHLNREGRERLREVFSRVDAEFRSLFTRLFGGGRAHLALVGSEDPLEAGLEIYAEPPGKKLSALSLLSGGEQALTALSLIFAVFRCHPAPVCVLDEVDAPLDDANVERLCDLLDHMAAEGGTRFLIVTHHPLTMARMHRLYGVTMQERGVSRLLSVDLARAVELVDGPQSE